MTDDPYRTHRSLLFTVAHERLRSAADADSDDGVQERWLRWAEADRAERAPRAQPVRIVTR
jgi:hypothetical protein